MSETSYSGNIPSSSFSIDPDELVYRLEKDTEHPVMWYVKNLPFEDAVYPAL